MMVSDRHILDAAGGVYHRLGRGRRPEQYRMALTTVLQAHGLQSRTQLVTRVGNYDDVEVLDVVDLDDALLVEDGLIIHIRADGADVGYSLVRLTESMQQTGASRGLLLDFTGEDVTAVPFLPPVC